MALLLGSAVFVTTGCKEGVDETGQSSTPNLSNKGGIKFIVKDKSDNPVPNARIGLALSQSDLITNTYLASKTTDSDGEADLGRFTGGNYYYEIDVTVGSTAFHGEGAVQIVNGEDIVKELTLD